MGSKSKMGRGRRGKMNAAKEMHHLPGGKVKGGKADAKGKHRNVAGKMMHQDPMV